MLPKKRTFIIALLIALAVTFTNIGFGQGIPGGSPEERALELRNLLDTIDGVAEERPWVFRSKAGYLRFIMAPPSTHFPAEGATPQEAADAFLKLQNLPAIRRSSTP